MSGSDPSIISSLPVSPRVSELYKQVMALYANAHISEVFGMGASENTIVFIRDSVSTNHTLWFYRFSHSKLPLIEIIDQGRTLVRRVDETVLSEDRLVMELQVLLPAIIFRRDQASIAETGLPYEIAMGLKNPPEATNRRKPYTRTQR